MKRFKDFLGNEITDPWFLNILQRLDKLKKRNKGRKNFSEEDKKELDSIAQELTEGREILKKELDKIPKSELAKRIQINQDNNRLFDFSTRRRLRSTRKGVF
ncbi:MAG TPA: hypothetical protein VF220_06990 [Nitrososphaeraceae archaeon]